MQQIHKKYITPQDIITLCKGQLLAGEENMVLKTFSNDTRTLQRGDFYLGIKGEKFNGGDFWEQALKKGAIGVMIQNVSIKPEKIEEYKDKIIIQVPDVIKAIQTLAAYKRSLYSIPVVAVTGSVGKTSTKDMIASVMAQKFQVLKTKGNFNNHIGLPLTILSLQEEEAMVVEMGMNNLGEIRILTNIAKPTACVITNIGTSHIGNLGSRQNILKAKLEILEGMESKGTLILNNDNDLLKEWNKNQTQYHTITYGIEVPSDYNAYDIKQKDDESTYLVDVGETSEAVCVPVPGKHFIYNSLCSIVVGRLFHLSMQQIQKGIQEFELTEKRMEISTIPEDITLINDCYNANYDSMKYAIEYLGSLQGKRKIAVLGDMLELGEYAKQLHEKIGIQLKQNNIDLIITVGELAKYISDKALCLGFEKENIYCCTTNEQAIRQLKAMLKPKDAILIKASHGMKFHEIVSAISPKEE